MWIDVLASASTLRRHKCVFVCPLWSRLNIQFQWHAEYVQCLMLCATALRRWWWLSVCASTGSSTLQGTCWPQRQRQVTSLSSAHDQVYF